MKHFKSKNGITLIALVITIIVLLILAGISIAIMSGENGILARAVDSKQNTIVGEDKEKINLVLSEYEVLKHTANQPTIEDLFKSKEWCENATLGEGTIKIEMTNGNEYDVEIDLEEDLTPGIKFYQPYCGIMDGSSIELVFHEDGSYERYNNDYKEGFCTPPGTVTYEDEKAIFDGGEIEISDNGYTIKLLDVGNIELKLNKITKKYIDFNATYICEYEDGEIIYVIFNEDGSTIEEWNGEEISEPIGTLEYKEEYFVTNYEGDIERHGIHPSGQKVIYYGTILEIDCSHENTEIRNETENYTGDTYCKDCGRFIEEGQYSDEETPGLYAEDGSIINTWEELLREGSVTVDGTKLTKIDFELQGYKLVIPASVQSCGGDESANRYDTEAFVYGNTEWEECPISIIVFQNGTKTIGTYSFSNSHGVTVYFPETVTVFETYAMCSLDGIAHYKGIAYDMRLDGDVWFDTWDIFNELPEAQENAMYVYK